MPALSSESAPGVMPAPWRSKAWASPWSFALAGTLLLFLWQAFTVYALFGGDWSALFVTGEFRKLPPELEAETYRWRGVDGYDGQFYRLVAHDPWIERLRPGYMDDPVLRSRRILVPGLAHWLAMGRREWIDAAYIAVILGCVLAGIWWLSAYSQSVGAHPAWGLLFAVLPATLVSIERMTVDVALAAACAGYLFCEKQGKQAAALLVLAAGVLIRETGILLVAAAVLFSLAGRQWRKAALFASAALPALLWYGFVHWRVSAVTPAAGEVPAVPPWMFQKPLVGIVERIFSPIPYPFGGWKTALVQVMDTAAWLGVILGLAVTLWWLRKRPWRPEQFGAAAYWVLVMAVSVPEYWLDANGWVRILAPWYLFLAVHTILGGSRWFLLPLVTASLRIGLQMLGEVVALVRGLSG